MVQRQANIGTKPSDLTLKQAIAVARNNGVPKGYIDKILERYRRTGGENIRLKTGCKSAAAYLIAQAMTDGKLSNLPSSIA